VTVRREAGEEWVVQVHYDEGVANHIGPEPCVVGCEAGGEASAGDCGDSAFYWYSFRKPIECIVML
jgi:hypothetical protein